MRKGSSAKIGWNEGKENETKKRTPTTKGVSRYEPSSMRLPVWTFFRRSYKFQSFYAFARFRKDNLPQTSTFDSLFLSFRDKKVIHTVVPVVVIPWELLYSKVKRGTVKWVMFRTSNREGDEAYKESLFWNNILPKYDWRHRRTFVRRDWPQKAWLKLRD